MSDRDALMARIAELLKAKFEERLGPTYGPIPEPGPEARSAIESAINGALDGTGAPGLRSQVTGCRFDATGRRLILSISWDPVTVAWLVENGHARIEGSKLVFT